MSQNAQYSLMHTTLQKQMSFEAQYNKNIKLTIDKQEKIPHLNYERATLIPKEETLG